MTCDLLTKWLKHYDPVHRGWTPTGIAHGVCVTNGFSFPRIRGGYILRRTEEGSPGAVSEIVGSAGADAEAIRTFPWVVHQAGAGYVYRLAAVNGGGCENETDVTTAIGFDASGAWAGGRPNAPSDLRLAPLAGGRFQIAWTYNDTDEAAAPVRFHIYHDGGTGTIDYSAVAGTVEYVPGRFHFRHDSEAFDHGTRVRWSVRSVNASGLEDGNTRWATGTTDAQAPPVHPSVHVRCEDSTA